MNDVYRYNRDGARRNPGTTTVKDAINQLLKHYQLQSRFNETYLEAFWAKMMGHTIASRTKRLYVKERILYIEIESAPLRSELVNAKSKMITRINEDMGTSVIDDVVFV
jgi:predicted nucleic acid-binding Zn ribbon protein